jgi:DNA mismatch repair ATPase MutS
MNAVTKNILYHNEDTYTDLSIGDDIFGVIDRTITKYGALKLRNRLKYYSTDPTDLKNIALRNYAIHLDLEYRMKTSMHLNEIKKIENTIEAWMLDQCNKNLIFGWDFLNNRYLLSMTNKLKISSMLIVVVFYVLMYLYLYYYGLAGSPMVYIKDIVKSYYYFSKLLVCLIFSNKTWIERSAIGITCVYIMYQLYITYQSVNTCYEHYGICNSFYVEYEQTSRFIEIADKMTSGDIYYDTDKVKKSVEFLKKYFVDDVGLGYSLVTKLSTDDYVKHIDVISNYVGKIDYQMCISELLDEGYTIPNVVNANFPILHIDNVWNPLINPDKRVKNSIELNLMKPNVVIITGPNKAGKSTFMRALILCVYMSQSLGICCADRTSFTPFRDIFTYLNVPDCIGRESLFEAELNRCYNYIDQIESMRGFSIGIIDELFTGTNPKEGKAASYAILKRISENPINITILSTHFSDIINKLDKNNFVFKKFGAKKINNKFVFNYSITDGVSDQHIALELLKERGFAKEIIDNALEYINKCDDK